MAIRAFFYAVVLAFFSLPMAQADSCYGDNWKAALGTLEDVRQDDEVRGVAAACLVRSHLSRPEVATAVLDLLKKPQTPLFLKEDIVEALGSAAFRRTIVIREPQATGPISPQDKVAVGPTVASVSSVLESAEAVRTTKEVLPVTNRETEIVRALGEIVIDEESHVILRGMAVAALSNISKNMKDSGVYSDSTLHLAYESMRYASLMPGEATYFVGSAKAYMRVADAHNRILSGLHPKATRGLASEAKKP